MRASEGAGEPEGECEKDMKLKAGKSRAWYRFPYNKGFNLKNRHFMVFRFAQ